MLANHWYPVSGSDSLSDRPVGVRALNRSIVLFRNKDGVSALSDICPHRGSPLSPGKVVEGDIACPYHGIRFGGDGHCTFIPMQNRIPDTLKVQSFPVVERFGLIWLWPGDPERADAGLLPALPWREDTAWNSELLQSFQLNAPAKLVIDNLLDLSHVAFVHENTIGFPPGALAQDPLVTESIGDRIRNTRIFENVAPPPTHRAWRDFKGAVTRSSISEWEAPGRVMILVRNEDQDGQLDVRFDHFVTPETENSCHYFVAISRNFQIDDQQMTEAMDRENAKVHIEDKEMIEHQFATLRLHPAQRIMNLKQDAAIVRAEAILRKLENAEAAI